MRKKIYIALTALSFIGLALSGALVFRNSYVRLMEGFRDFGISVAYYFCKLFCIGSDIKPTVITISKISVPEVSFPSDWNGLKEETENYFLLLFYKDNFKGWLTYISAIAGNIAKVTAVLLPLLFAAFLLIKRLYKKENNRYGKDTLPLRIFKKISSVTYQPVKSFVNGYVVFIKENGWIYKVWLAVIVLHFNLGTIVMEFLAYYFYFAVSFDFSTIYTQFVKLFADLKTPFQHFPWVAVLPIAWLVFDWWRKKIALNRLRHFEARNCGFINELPIVSMSCGSMGKKKTTLITDMALSQEVMFRQKALEILQKADMKFPYFPWMKFEKRLCRQIRLGNVYNLATVKHWIKVLREKFVLKTFNLYGYDYIRYGLTFQDGLKTEDIFDVLETYSQAYFVYILESSLIISNYSIRTDNFLADCGNFPVWLTDFYPKNFRKSDRHAKILDFDILRLGKKVTENNPKAGSFEFGVLAITEIGKERGNTLELKEVKKGTEEANQKNDLFNSWLKMCRHSATIDNFPFIKVFTDEQRPESWGADARDLCDIIHIISSGEQRLTLPFYTIEEMIADWTFSRFINLYYDFRFRRGDNTLLIHILKSVTAWIWKRNLRVYNRYGYCVLHIETERGIMDGKKDRKKYFLCDTKIYRRRFATDCFSDYFNDLAKKTGVSFSDYLEYATEKASVEELKAQNSYFINSLYGGDNNAV